MGLIHRLSDLLSFGRVTISQTDLLAQARGPERGSGVPRVGWPPDPAPVEALQHAHIEEEFRLLIGRLGGADGVLLVGDASTGGHSPGRGLLCRELARELFGESGGSSGEDDPRACPQTDGPGPRWAASPDGLARSRSVTAKLVLFAFRLEWLRQRDSRVAVREILKDVRKRCRALIPTVLALIYCQDDGSETAASLQLLSRDIAEVFQIPSGSVPACVSPYISSTSASILNAKRRVCQLLTSRDT
ncbi:hypothetical protein scyTo_0023552, partial [Scyliorhinus torazame]|nr:hypothetical protein [Scyliorhinus torazame]